jgi:tetratricopeptide (TPR) repeat protein
VAGRVGIPDVRAYALAILANSYYDLGKPGLAAQRDARALRIYEEIGDLSGQAFAHANLGADLGVVGRIDEALEHFRVALEMQTRMGNAKEVAIVNLNFGEHYIVSGDFELAAGHLESVLDQCSRMPSFVSLEGGACLHLARAYQGLGRYEEAEKALLRAGRLFEKAGTPRDGDQVAARARRTGVRDRQADGGGADLRACTRWRAGTGAPGG